ncbi:MAG: hypothetical protein D4R64_04335 [Porphyromonadaceae bacterium]|nr:MAG: hypothetical protein D4R64_04335 [Porphyromonadaceae bacterium]
MNKKYIPEYGFFVVLSILIIILASIIIYEKTNRRNRDDTSDMITQKQATGILQSSHFYKDLGFRPELLRDDKWESLNMTSNFFQDNSFIVCLWYPEELCESCYSEELESFKHFSDKIGYDKTAIITNSLNPRIVRTLIKSNKLRFPVVSLVDRGVRMNQVREPVLFLLNQRYQVESPVLLLPGSKNVMAVYFNFAIQLLDSTYNKH